MIFVFYKISDFTCLTLDVFLFFLVYLVSSLCVSAC